MKNLVIGALGILGVVGVISITLGLNVDAPRVGPELKVYKTSTCGCCGDWIKHMKRVGFAVDATDVTDLGVIKSRYGIQPRLQSCHTAVSAEGYIFEGHIPGKVVRAFLDNPVKDAIGLTAPGMPLGSPGMVGRFEPYDVLLVRNDGSIEVYQRIESPDYE